MTDETENHTIRLLQELREEMRGMRAEFTERMDDLTNRVDGNTLILNMIAGLVSDHEHRIEVLEKVRP